jgi:hypothetical protein
MGCRRGQPAGKKFERVPEKQTLGVVKATGGKRISPNGPYVPLSGDMPESPDPIFNFKRIELEILKATASPLRDWK